MEREDGSGQMGKGGGELGEGGESEGIAKGNDK